MSARIQFVAPHQSPPAVELDAARWDDVERALLALPTIAAYRARDMGARLSLIAGSSTSASAEPDSSRPGLGVRSFRAVAALPFVDGAVGFLAYGPELDEDASEEALRPYVAIRSGERALITARGLLGANDDVRIPVRALTTERVGIC